MLTLHKFSAWITSEGRPLQEYLVAVDTNANKVSCWIPSEAGKNFSIHWRDEGTRVHSCAFISLDGFWVPGRFLCGYGEAWRDGVRTGSDTERPFVFAEQTSTCSGGQIDPHAGTISLKIRCVTIEGSRLANKFQQLPEPSGSQGNMLTHYINYGEQRQTYLQSAQTWNVKPYDGSSNQSYITFVFRYRSREFFLSQGIMPTDDEALQIPPAVKRACAMSRHVTNALLSVDSTTFATPHPTPSPQENNSEWMGSALQNTFDPVSIQPITNVRTVSTKAPSHQDHYPGESILNLGVDPNMLRM